VSEEKVKLPPAETADDILCAPDLEVVEVQVPEWNRTVYIRSLPADEGLRVNEVLQALPDDKKTEALFLMLRSCLVSADGKPLITNDEQFQRLHGRSSKVLVRLNEIALDLQGWSGGGEAAKNG
jgi:hypothetical protein